SLPTFASPLLILGALIAALFFNGYDIRYFALSMSLLTGWLAWTAWQLYRQPVTLGSTLLPTLMLLYWLWLAFSILFSQVTYLSVVNFWWVGALPLVFLGYTLSPERERLWHRLFPGLVILGLALTALALYQFFVLQGPPAATFFNKNSLAALLNLLLFPLLGVFLAGPRRAPAWLLGTSLFSFVFLLALIQSRAALLGFGLGFVVLAGLALRQLDRRRLLILVGGVVAALGLANLALQLAPAAGAQDLLTRLATLQDTGAAGYSRFVIWGPAWELLRQHPFTGIGLGTYFLAIPPTLHPADHSAGFYVHNDYLQIALETGLPGLLLLLAILVAVVYRLLVALRQAGTDQPRRLELLSLFAALFSLAFHSALSFNFYIMPTMLIAGLWLGRFHQLADQLAPVNVHQVAPAALFRPAIYRFALAGLSLILIGYFTSLGLASHYQNRGRALAAETRLEQAHRAFLRAQRLSPLVDSPFYADADLLLKSARALKDKPELARGLLQEAQQKLARAEQLNPLRPQTWHIHAQVLELLHPDDRAAVIAAHEKALQVNPRYLPARLGLARYLAAQGETEPAYAVLQAGLGYTYRRLNPTLLEYIAMTRSYAEALDDPQLARTLASRLEELRAENAGAARRSAPPSQTPGQPY
ncbi:MAG: O-antigen ligase family protein, partial [Alphaproteobacteria bacterium]